MRRIEYSTKFVRDYKRISKGRYRNNLDGLLEKVLEPLIFDQKLHTRYQDHQLKGNWVGHRECHIKPDLLLIYKKVESDVVNLVRLGSHGELFK